MQELSEALEVLLRELNALTLELPPNVALIEQRKRAAVREQRQGQQQGQGQCPDEGSTLLGDKTVLNRPAREDVHLEEC